MYKKMMKQLKVVLLQINYVCNKKDNEPSQVKQEYTNHQHQLLIHQLIFNFNFFILSKKVQVSLRFIHISKVLHKNAGRRQAAGGRRQQHKWLYLIWLSWVTQNRQVQSCSLLYCQRNQGEYSSQTYKKQRLLNGTYRLPCLLHQYC